MARVGLCAGARHGARDRPRARRLPSIGTRTWIPSPDADSSLVLEPATTPGAWRWNLGALGPVRAGVRSSTAIAADRSFARSRTSSASTSRRGWGLARACRSASTFRLALWQDGDSPLPENLVQNGTVPTAALGDASVLGKVTLLSNDRQGVRSGFGVAGAGRACRCRPAAARAFFPTAQSGARCAFSRSTPWGLAPREWSSATPPAGRSARGRKRRPTASPSATPSRGRSGSSSDPRRSRRRSTRAIGSSGRSRRTAGSRRTGRTVRSRARRRSRRR